MTSSQGAPAVAGGGVSQQPPPPPPPQPPPPQPPSPPLAGPPVASVVPPGLLYGATVCGEGSFTFTLATAGVASLRLTGVSRIDHVRLSDDFAFFYEAANRYTLPAGLIETRLTPEDKQPSLSQALEYFRQPDIWYDTGVNELEIYRNAITPLSYATLGRLSTPYNICFYAVGAGGTNFLVDGTLRFAGFADGLLVGSGGNERLFGSKVLGEIDGNRREVRISMRLARRGDAFGEFLDAPATDIGEATARLTYDGAVFRVATLTGPDGATGTITGRIQGSNLAGVGFVFELTFPNGDRAFGAVAADLDTGL